MAKSNGNSAKYVYGVVRAKRGSRLKQSGINDEPVTVVASKGLGALTSDVPAGPLEAGREELLTHSRVLEKALHQRGVVLPMRFGVVMPDEGAVRAELLASHREQLAAQLDEMEGKVEINIKGIYDEEAILREVIAENPEIAELRQSLHGKPDDATYYERIRLGELVSDALTAKRNEEQARIVDRLAGSALTVEVGEPVHERMAVNASFLVERERLDEFDRAVDKIGEEQAHRIRMKYTGPLPPHSFVELAVEA
jgi:gamma-glutamylcyclotransferase (GGCT)/AIG2-like uncharacterized protein YtfP